MAKKPPKNRKGSRNAPPNPAAPKVHVKVAIANSDMRAAAALIKPAILYADTVTIYSPAASMITAIRELRKVTDTRDQIRFVATLIEGVPELRRQLDVDDSTIQQMMQILSIDRAQLSRIARATGAATQVDSLNAALGQMSATWAEELPKAVKEAERTLGATDLLVAVDAGAVKVGDLLMNGSAPLVVDSLRLATGAEAREPLDDLVERFVGTLLAMVSEPRTFPLFDAVSSGLLRALEATMSDGLKSPSRAGAEVAAAASFMGYLPNFASMPIDEVLDLRKELSNPLKRFRGAMARMSRDFESRPIDEAFVHEVDDAWRTQVEPALLDIREAMAEHGLLREVASVALGDPRRLIVEAGGVVAAAHGEVISLSGMLTAAAAAGVPAADVLGRALLESSRSRRPLRRHSFYFLHRVSERSAR